jgi:hypothetical protein
MDLKLATTEDILHELMKRQLRFALVVIEDTNSLRPETAYISAKGVDEDDVVELAAFGLEMLRGDEPESGNSDMPFNER